MFYPESAHVTSKCSKYISDCIDCTVTIVVTLTRSNVFYDVAYQKTISQKVAVLYLATSRNVHGYFAWLNSPLSHPFCPVSVHGCCHVSRGDRFHIDLSSGCSTKPRSDIALRFNARFEGTPSVTCNSLQQERWSGEQTLHQLPYKQGAPFETIILVHGDVFKASEVMHADVGHGLFAAD